MKDSALGVWNGDVLRTLELRRHYGRGTVVATRPGYNTCWETVAAGARLVLVGDYKGVEDTQATRDCLAARGLARCPATDGEALATAILEALDTPSDSAAAAAVNAGLEEIATTLVGILQS
jgi:UDP-N-acetylglucosamine:LPS N-acetylglucosamine transferase